MFEVISGLEVGQSYKLSFTTRNGASQMRHIIYGWLKENMLKNLYRVYWRTDTDLEVVKLDVIPKDAEITKKDKLSGESEKIFKEMIVSETPYEVVQSYFDKGIIDHEQLGKLITTYNEFNK
jgi:hypothetical protein